MTKRNTHLAGARVYLSGPMDFVASRAKEKQLGWRTRVGQFLHSCGVRVFDPWNKPNIRGLYEYGREDANSLRKREQWTFSTKPRGSVTRGECAASFWETLHIDLRMVDMSDFVIAYCPTNIYSVGTVHEIVVARLERKTVLIVSPKVSFPTLQELDKELEEHPKARRLLNLLKSELPIKENERGIPSLWYVPLVGSESFFDSFGFTINKYRRKFGWSITTDVDKRETQHPPERPLLPFLERIALGSFPRRWDQRTRRLVRDDDWLVMEEALEL